MRTKIGDTLVEVALAIGIFSMVAIVIVSVISASTSNAQTALEVTISREDLDAQAEALRFIHDSYMNDSQSEDTSQNRYHDLWQEITKRAISELEAESGTAPAYEVNFNPETCSELYEEGGVLSANAGRNPFIINIRNLGGNEEGKIDKNDIIVASDLPDSTNGERVFFEAGTFPRIMYGGADTGASLDKDSEEDSFYNQITNTQTNIKRVEGIYIIAIKGQHQIMDLDNPTSSLELKDAYFDFSIRSCWFPPGAKRASTISTTIRLYDPAVIEYSK